MACACFATCVVSPAVFPAWTYVALPSAGVFAYAAVLVWKEKT